MENQRIFMGSLAKEIGGEQLKEKYLIGPKYWFGDLNIGDILIASEDAMVNKVLKVKEIIDIDNENRKVNFEIIKEYIPSKKSSLVFGSKYFKLDIVTFTNAYKPAYSSGRKSHFYQLDIEDNYRDKDITTFNYDEKDARNIYVTIDVEKIKEKKEGDLFFVVSAKESGYKLIETLEYKKNDKFERINIRSISNSINIEEYGFKKALEYEKKYERRNKSNLLNKVISQIDNKGYYKHPLESNLGMFYNILIVDNSMRKKELEDETEVTSGNTPENIPNEIHENEYNFISEDEIKKIKNILEFKKNIILEGVPGVGKTYIARKIAMQITGGKEDNIEMIQFHQSYSYEDFIEGLRPSNDGSGCFVPYPGILKRLCDDIKENNRFGEKFVIIIDEINRGNIGKIFGETLMLIEKDKRDKVEVRLPYSQNEKFTIPDNIFFIGTMNTMDKSISLFDFALGRRFSRYELKPCFDDEHEEVKIEIERYLNDINSDRLNILWKKIKKINNISDEEMDDILIGHSYLCGLNKYSKEEIDEKIEFIVDYEILPQIKEYLLGENEKIKKLEKYLKVNNKNINLNEEEENNNNEE